ncbi:MAG: hypothetical protein HS107_05830 [Thermoflexaceae bacterium]|nr:hypothetical protein [Thermoflexaceae bacterium]
MSGPSIDRLLIELERAPRWEVARFDAGHPFSGRVAVLPSAFNPPTVAHLELLALARNVPGVVSTAAMLSTRNVDKGLHGASLPHRIGMLLAVAERGEHHAVLGANAARIADQGEALRRRYPGVPFDFVAGFDTLVRLFDPRYYENMAAELAGFFAHHRVIATNRGEAHTGTVRDFIESTPAARDYRERVLVHSLAEHPASLSSTQAREAAARGKEHPAVPAEVAEYIRRHRLYRDR